MGGCEFGRWREGDDIFVAVLGDREIGGALAGGKVIAKAFEHRRHLRAERLGRERAQEFQGWHAGGRQSGKFLLAQVSGGGFEVVGGSHASTGSSRRWMRRSHWQ
jgi:hypothetical protein